MPKHTHFPAFFNRLAPHYEDYSLLARAIDDELLERLPYLKHTPSRVLDLGCGTGYATRRLAEYYPQAEISGLDFSPRMIHFAEQSVRQKGHHNIAFVCEEMIENHLPAHSVDLIYANLVMPYCDPKVLLEECARLLKPSGVLFFTTLGPDTFYELREAAAGHFDTQPFLPDMHTIGDLLLELRFTDPVVDVKRENAHFETLAALLQALKWSGYCNLVRGNRTRFISQEKWEQLETAYEMFREEEGLPVSLEIIFGQAWGCDPTVQTVNAAGEVRVDIRQLINKSY